MKKFVILTMAVLAAVLVMATGCDSSRDPMFVINEACARIPEATKVVTTSSVSRDDLMITETEKTYVKGETSLTVTTVTTVLNELPAEEEYTVSTTTDTVEGGFQAMAAFAVSEFTSYTVSESVPVVLTASLTAEQTEARFGIRPETEGLVSLTVRLNGTNRIERLELHYTTPTGNQAAVVVSVVY